MKKIIFEGVGTAMVTPMYEDGKINYHVFKQLLEMQIEKKADAVIIAGTTGEGSTLSDEEHIALVEYAVKTVHGRIPVIAGAGSNNTAHAIYMSKQCEKAGADGLFSLLCGRSYGLCPETAAQRSNAGRASATSVRCRKRQRQGDLLFDRRLQFHTAEAGKTGASAFFPAGSVPHRIAKPCGTGFAASAQ